MARSSHLRCSIKAAVIKSFAIFSVKHMCCGLFLIKLGGVSTQAETMAFRPAALLKRDSNTGVFL